MNRDFEGKIALVTGAANGIGLATAKQLASRGASVILTDINEAALARVCDSLRASGSDVFSYVCDVSDETRVNEVAADVLEKFGKLDILVNNAGIYKCDLGPFNESQSDFWRKKIDINILGTLYFTRAVINSMLGRGYGRIINIASVAAVYGIVNMVDYSMTKGAIVSFTRALAKETTPHGVLVNAVSPGNIDENPANLPALSFIDRSGSPDECANLICFLASDAASYISGQNYQVDGCRKKM